MTSDPKPEVDGPTSEGEASRTDGGDAGAPSVAGQEAIAPSPEPQPDFSKLDLDTLRKMRAAGLPKPPGVPWSHWLGIKKLNHRHEFIALLAASGKPNVEIANETGMTESRLSLVLRSPIMLTRIRELREKFYGEGVKAKFQQMLPAAQEFYREVLHGVKADGTTVAHDTKLKRAVAKDLFDRVLGKPKETLEIQNKSVAELYVFLDDVMAGKRTIDVTPARAASAPLEALPAEARAEALAPAPAIGETKKKDVFAEIDSWVDEHVPVTAGFGAKKEGKS